MMVFATDRWVDIQRVGNAADKPHTSTYLAFPGPQR
jgi:hypothetical protein